jgi:putative ABC transport system permease protein
LPVVLSEPGVRAAWPVCRVDVALSGRESYFLEVVGFDLFAPRDIPWNEPIANPAAVLAEPGWAAVSPALATEMSWKIGDRFEVTSGSRRVMLTVGALVDLRKWSPLAGARLVIMDIAQVQGLFASAGSIDQIDVAVVSGSPVPSLIERLESRLDASARVLTPDQHERQAASLLGAFRLNLTALSLVSLLVGGFLVYTATQASLIRRRAELGVLRSLGATRGQVLAIILAEVGLLGLAGVALGLPAGYLAAATTVDQLSAALTHIYVLRAVESLVLPPQIHVLAVVVGLSASLLGAALPAWDMSRRETRSLLAAFTLHERLRRSSAMLFLSGLSLIVVVAGAGVVLGDSFKPYGFVLALSLLCGIPLMTPWLLGQISRALPTGRLGVRYGMKTLGLQLQTSSFAIAALAVSVSLMLGVTLMVGSFRRTIEEWVGSTVRADVYISTLSWTRGRREATMDEPLAAALAAHPGVRSVERLRQFFVWLDGLRVTVSGVGGDLGPEDLAPTLMHGDAREAFLRLGQGAALVSEPLSRKAGLGVGDTLTLPSPSGYARFPIAGVYYDYTTESGSVFMDLTTMVKAFGPAPINNMALHLEPGRDTERMVDELKAAFPDQPLHIRSNRALRGEILALFDETFAITGLLEITALLIAVTGIALSLLVLARERVAELALYRALGALKQQIFAIFMGKGLGMALLGLVLGAVGGFGLAAVLIYVINRAYFGWTIQFHPPEASILRGAVAVVVVALLAALYPALRASDTPAVELSREDV